MSRPLKTGIVPAECKHAKVTPLYKEGNRDDTITSIALKLPVVMKIFEAAVNVNYEIQKLTENYVNYDILV